MGNKGRLFMDVSTLTKKIASCAAFVLACMVLTGALGLAGHALAYADTEQRDVVAEAGAENDFATISSAEELLSFAAQVNAGVLDTYGKTFTLACDIDLSGASWTPIGSPESGIAFEGIFDGQGHAITGLSVTKGPDGYADNVALFGYSTGTIRNLSVSGEVAGASRVAGVVAYGAGTIENVTSYVGIFCEQNFAGGIVADAAGELVIYDCHNAGAITNGGVAQELGSGRFGGIVGRVDTGTSAVVTNCSNLAGIVGYQYVGGIVGAAFGSVAVKACFNEGDLSSISYGMTYLGGIVGKLQAGTVDSCYNLGSINNVPVDAGHRRAVGGIVGCEYDHEPGTAVSRCYNAGAITIDTASMVAGDKFIYMAGNISGGNSKTAANTMKYENCFYLEGTFPLQNESHESYLFWSDVFKSNPLAYDTEYVTACTAEELSGSDVLSKLGSSFASNGEGFPLLYWQLDFSDAPDAEAFALAGEVLGGQAVLDLPSMAVEGSLVNVSVSGVEDGKTVKRVVVSDVSGASFEAEESLSGGYVFAMPGRAAKVTVWLENVVSDDASEHRLILPDGLDAIWAVSVDSSHLDEASGKVKAGATVTVIVEKNPLARTTVLAGISVGSADGSAVSVSATNVKVSDGAVYYGEYTFTMPASDAELGLSVGYVPMTVFVQQGDDAEPQVRSVLSRDDMLQLSADNVTAYYSYWESETSPKIGVAERYVTLDQLLAAAGVTFEEGDALIVEAVDGFAQSYTYEHLVGAARSYYAGILTEGTAASATNALAPMFTIKANVTGDAGVSLDDVACDTLYAYRFIYGLTADEFASRVKMTDAMPQSVSKVTVVKTAASPGSGDLAGDPDPDDSQVGDNTGAGEEGSDVDASAKAESAALATTGDNAGAGFCAIALASIVCFVAAFAACRRRVL